MSPLRTFGLSLVFVVPALAISQSTPKKPPQIAYPEQSARGNARIFYWGGDHSGGQTRVEFGTPVWKDEYDKAVDEQRGVRWRLGQNFWTSLDTNIDLDFSGKAVVAGGYYLVLERKKDGGFALIALDPVEQRDRHLDAYQAQQTTGGIELPMQHRLVEAKAEKLELRLDVDATHKDLGTFVIRFGKHELTAPFTLKPERG